MCYYLNVHFQGQRVNICYLHLFKCEHFRKMLGALEAPFEKLTFPTVMPLHCHISNRIMPLQSSHSYYEYMTQSSTPHPREGVTSPFPRRLNYLPDSTAQHPRRLKSSSIPLRESRTSHSSVYLFNIIRPSLLVHLHA